MMAQNQINGTRKFAEAVRVTADTHRALKIRAAEQGTTVSAIVEEAVTRHLGEANGKSKRKAA